MPVIPEEDEDEAGMEFLNLDSAGPDMGVGMDLSGLGSEPLLIPTGADGSNNDNHNHDFELALENVEGDDFSFWALQHYENSNLLPSSSLDPTVEPNALELGIAAAGVTSSSATAFQEYGAEPEFPCEKCRLSGFLCKKIREGRYKGYCTSCVALRCRCSFAWAATAELLAASDFPCNPWPTLGDHPDAIPQEDITTTLTHHGVPQQQGSISALASASSMDLAGLTSLPPIVDPVLPLAAAGSAGNGPKIGTRFSRESVRILKNWLSTHNRHPYPTDDEKELLQKQTGLNKLQITNWLANARRRGKIVAPRSTSPGIRNWSNAIDIPPRRSGTPASFEHMNPLQRWQYSPPEHEPASVQDIARAVSSSTLSSGLNSPFSFNLTDDGSGRSQCAGSSASSVNTSHSSTGSMASAYSHASLGSFGSFGSHSMNNNHRGRRRRRRRGVPRSPDEKTSLATPLKTYMCTFCTETFRTKHDWQRHEKSLHLSLERWVCAPDGPRAFNPENDQVSCVFCGQATPDDAHVESHNHSACQERTLEERTFYRKDHLRQHLKLVHGARYIGWSMEPWKVATPEIRSRCGFCGLVMDTWSIRVDHLAEHFKTGNTMADWKGDWGFDAPVLDMVENSIPPYLIHDERNTPQPFMATQGSPESPRNAYELIKSELSFFGVDYRERNGGRQPSDDELQVEACRVIFGAEVLSTQGISSVPSWLRDLLLSSESRTLRAQLAPIRSAADSHQARLSINGKDNMFEDDTMEAELHEYVKARRLLGLTAMDSELQAETCNIIGRMEESSSNPSDEFANFLVRLVFSGPQWLANFRQRAVLPRSEDLRDVAHRSTDPTTIDSTIHNYSRLERELAEYVRVQRLAGVEPADADLQRQARVIIYEFDDGWNQTAADNLDWLDAFKLRHVSAEASAATLMNGKPLTFASLVPSAGSKRREQLSQLQPSSSVSPGSRVGASNTTGTGTQGANANTNKPVRVGRYFLNDANCYRRLARELTRYVASTMSPNNPNCHVPSDEEIQHQARWILYDCDDAWNITAADNAEWLRRFKRDVGILTDPTLPGLPAGYSWNVTQGGSGFAPPYAVPNPRGAPICLTTDGVDIGRPSRSGNSNGNSAGNGNSGDNAHGNLPRAAAAATTTQKTDYGENNNNSNNKDKCMVPSNVEVTMNDGARSFSAEAATANKYLRALTTRLSPPATVFCSRELEKGLIEFVTKYAAAAAAEGKGKEKEGETSDAQQQQQQQQSLLPDDEALRAKAREILNIATTSAEDQVLLDKFKAMMRQRLMAANDDDASQQEQEQEQGAGAEVAAVADAGHEEHDDAQSQLLLLPDMDMNMNMNMNMNVTDRAIDDILQDMDFEFGDYSESAGMAGFEGLDQL